MSKNMEIHRVQEILKQKLVLLFVLTIQYSLLKQLLFLIAWPADVQCSLIIAFILQKLQVI
jgi:hypothetical protein